MTPTKRAPGGTRAIHVAKTFVETLCNATGDNTIGAQQILLLTALYVHGTLNQVDLPKFTGVERSANSRNISRLGSGQWVPKGPRKVHEAGLGLVENYPDPLDRRVNLVRLTPVGRATVEQAGAAAAAFLE